MVSPEEIMSAPLIEFDYDLDQAGRFIVYSSNESGIPRIYLKHLDESNPIQLTHGEQSVKRSSLSPQGDKLALLIDDNGDELYRVFLLDLKDENPQPVMICDTKYRTYGFGWHPNGKEITRTITDATISGLQTINTSTGEFFTLLEYPKSFMSVNYSNSGEWIACATEGKDSYFSESVALSFFS